MLHVISLELAASLSIVYTLLYVAVLYLHPSARPTRLISKDHPNVIKTRIIAVSFASAICAACTVYVGAGARDTYASAAIRILGLRLKPQELSQSLLLTSTLFAGPLFEYLLAEGGLLTFPRDIYHNGFCWIGIRNYLAGPATEEFVFRACIIPLHFYASVKPGYIIFITPLYFGLAHVHHIYERTRQAPGHLAEACLVSLVQFTYTTIFGWFASFIFMRTGSLLACIAVHSFCNVIGLPRVTGRVRGGIWKSVLYYILLVGGVLCFALQIDDWTASATGYQPYDLY
jgi:prenyl protein peptidase